MNTVAACCDCSPTETGRELTAVEASAALTEAMVTVTKPADRQLTVRALDVSKVGRWVVLKAKLVDGPERIEFTVRMPRARAESFLARLSKVLA